LTQQNPFTGGKIGAKADGATLTRPAATLSRPTGEGKRLSRSSRLSQGEKKNYDYSISLKSEFSRISQ